MKKIFTKSISMLLMITMLLSGIFVSAPKEVKADSKAYTIKVNLGTNCTTIYKNGKAIKAMICSPSNETPTGTFYVPAKYRWHEMIGNCYAQYCTRICPQILFHSVWYYKNGDKSSMSVAAYNVMGQKASHGCVRLLCKDSKWIYDHCAVGTKVVIFWGSKKDDPLKRPGFTPITNGKFTDWDPTDPDPRNPYKKKMPTLTVNKTTVEFGTNVKAIDLVTIKDSAGNTMSKKSKKIKVKGKINTKKLGTYKVKFTVKGKAGKTLKKTVEFKVVDTKKPTLKGVKNKNSVALNNKIDLLSGVSAKAATGKDLTSRVKTAVTYKGKKVTAKKNKITFTKVGTYKVTYTVKGNNKKSAKKTVTYKVVNQSVKFYLKHKKVTIEQGTAFDYLDQVKSLKSYKGKDLSVKKYVTYTDSVDMTKPGTYTVTYKAQYKDQPYTAVAKTLTVVVKEKAQQPTEPEQPTQPTGPSGANANDSTGWTENY